MDGKEFKENWDQLKGKLQERWGLLREEDIDKIDGDLTNLIGRLQVRYGKTLMKVQREIEEWDGDKTPA